MLRVILSGRGIGAIMRADYVLLVFLYGLVANSAAATERFIGFNDTASTVFTGVYLAPHSSGAWGANEALNDKDHVWDPGERLVIGDVSRGIFDLKVVDRNGRVCYKHAIDLTKDKTFDIREDDLRDCK